MFKYEAWWWPWLDLLARIALVIVVVVALALCAQLFMSTYIANSREQRQTEQLERKYYELKIQELEAKLEKEAPPDE